MVLFPRFYMFLEVLHVCPCTWCSSHWLPLGEKYFLSALIGVLRLSETLHMGMSAPHFLLHIVAEFLNLYTFSLPCKARPSANSLPLLSLGSTECSSLWFLPGQQLWSSSLCVLPLCLGKLTFTALGTWTGRRPQGRGGWVSYTECWGYLWASWGIHQWGIPYGLSVGLLMCPRVQDAVGRVYILLTCPVLSSDYCFLPAHWLPVMLLMTRCSGWGKRGMGIFGTGSHSWGSWVVTHTSDFSHEREIMAEKGSLGPRLYHLWGGVTWVKSNCSSSPPQCVQSCFCCCWCCSYGVIVPKVPMELFQWTPGLPQRLSCLWIVV